MGFAMIPGQDGVMFYFPWPSREPGPGFPAHQTRAHAPVIHPGHGNPAKGQPRHWPASRGRRFTAVRSLAAGIALLALAPLAAQEATAAAPAAPEFSRGDGGLSVLLSTGIQLATVGESFGYGQDWFPYAMLGTASLIQLPGLGAADPDIGLRLVAQAGLDAAFVAGHLTLANPILDGFTFNLAHKYAMWGAYENYSLIRSRSVDTAYRDSFTRLDFGQLASAPFDFKTLEPWQAWSYLGGLTLAIALRTVFSPDQSAAVWTTGTSYFAGQQMPIALGALLMLAVQIPSFTMTAIGEESFYRGTVMEELQTAIGEWPARIIDANFFTLSHWPQQLDKFVAANFWSVLLDYSLSVGTTLWVQEIYRRGGLRSAVAVHMWSDVVMMLADWLLKSGADTSPEAGLSINARSLRSVTFQIRLL
jgi:membrane protease YdiL (CAAX protease family)